MNRVLKMIPRDLTSLVSLLCFALATVLAVFYYFSIYEDLPFQLFAAGLVMLIPLLLTRMGFPFAGTVCLSYLVVFIPMFLSTYNKHQALIVGNTISAVNYFDVRIVIICSILVPMTTIPLKKRWVLCLGALPSFLGLAFFDPLHEYLNVGYYDAGLTSPDYYFSVNLFSAVAWLFLAMAFIFLKYTIERSLDEEKFRRNRLSLYMKDLMELGNSRPMSKGLTMDGYKQMLGRIESSLENVVVSIWEFEENYRTMVCKANSSKYSHYQRDFKVNLREDEQYFSDLFDKGIIISNQGNPLRSNGTHKYAYLHNSRSFLDVIFFRFGKPHGVLSCELKNSNSTWSAEDSLFLKAAGDLVSLLHANEVQRIRNEELEKRVDERTAQLQQTNQELQEYAFLNSHILRAPISRVFGMYQVIEAEYADVMNDEILSHFKISIQELDKITRRIDMEIAALTR